MTTYIDLAKHAFQIDNIYFISFDLYKSFTVKSFSYYVLKYL